VIFNFLTGQSVRPSLSIHFRKDLRLAVTDTFFHFDVSRILETLEVPSKRLPLNP
jgi:hypothetical protein